MALQHHDFRSRRGALLSRHDRWYLLSLLIPFVAYDLALKILRIAATRPDPEETEALELMQIRLSTPEPPPLADTVGLIQSDIFFHLSYCLLWVVLFAVARIGIARRATVTTFHALTICITTIATIAYQYFIATGSPLDWETLVLGLASLDEVNGLIASEINPGGVVVLTMMLFYALLGPRVITGLIERRSARREQSASADHGRRALLSLPMLALASLLLFVFSLLPGIGTADVSKSFARDPFVNVIVTSVATVQLDALPETAVAVAGARLPSEARLHLTATTRQRNVVLIYLESTRAGATTPYNKKLATTPFLDRLARQSLLVEQAYAIIPHTHSALTAINCGIDPPLYAKGARILSTPGILPRICLPHLLREQGYSTVFFKSTVRGFENSWQIIKNLGYQKLYALENMRTAGFERTNYFGYEDEIMLEPSRRWLEAHRGRPFLAAYLTSAPHHDYLAPHRRHGRIAFTEDDVVNRYLNSIRNQDFFLKELFAQYRRLGLYDNTVFVLIGDHGQGFGEHGRNGHDNAIYEEGLRVPLLIHDPRRFRQGARLAGPVNQLDILPTVVDLLGYRLEGQGYSGSSLLRPLPAGRTLMFTCAGGKACTASLSGNLKYINHFDDRPDELFDLAADPGERNNLVGERSPAELSRLRTELLTWRANVRAMYVARGADD